MLRPSAASQQKNIHFHGFTYSNPKKGWHQIQEIDSFVAPFVVLMEDRSAKKQSPLKALLSIEKTIRKGTLCAKYCLKYYCLRRLASSFFLWRQNARVLTILLSVNSSYGNNNVLAHNGNGDSNSKIMSKSELIGSKSVSSGVVDNYPATPSKISNNNTYNDDYNDNNNDNIGSRKKDKNVELTIEQRRQNVLMYAKQILSQTSMNPTSSRSKPQRKGLFSTSRTESPVSRVFMDTEASKSRSYSNRGDKNSRAISPASVETYRSRKSDTAITSRRGSWGHYTDNSSISRRGRSGSYSDNRGRRSLSSESKSSTLVSSASKILSHTQSSKKKTATIVKKEKKSHRRTYTNYESDNNGNNNYNYYDHIVSRNNQKIDRAQLELFRVGYSENNKNTKGWRDSLRL